MLPLDGDNDYPVNTIVIDRRRYRPIHFVPVLYDGCKDNEKFVEEALLDNLDIAMSELKMFRRKQMIKRGK